MSTTVTVISTLFDHIQHLVINLYFSALLGIIDYLHIHVQYTVSTTYLICVQKLSTGNTYNITLIALSFLS